ncbi:MAG: phytanoyl-CoA dioxygenase family protein [Acidimicrobiia bacterium]
MSTDHHLTPDQLAFYDENGYLLLRNHIPGNMLERLSDAAHSWISLGSGADPANPGDFQFAMRDGHSTMWRVDYVHDKGRAESLALLGSPQVLGVAESMCGPNFVPTYESLVFKQEGDGAAVAWHQDAVHPRKWRIFNFDLYLDESLSGAGALWVVPGSHLSKHDVCAVADDHGWNVPGAVEVEMGPGDVLLHDVMILHGSPATEGNALRRTIYYEFRAAEEILADGPWDRTWIDQRIRLIPLGIQAHSAMFPQTAPFQWKVADEFRPEMSTDIEAELRVAHLTHMNGSWCSAGDAGAA